MGSVLRGCNIGGGEEILKNLSRMEVPLAFFQQQQRESGIPAGGAQGGWKRRREGALIFEQEVYCQQLESVFGGVLSPSVVTSPYL